MIHYKLTRSILALESRLKDCTEASFELDSDEYSLDPQEYCFVVEISVRDPLRKEYEIRIRNRNSHRMAGFTVVSSDAAATGSTPTAGHFIAAVELLMKGILRNELAQKKE